MSSMELAETHLIHIGSVMCIPASIVQRVLVIWLIKVSSILAVRI